MPRSSFAPAFRAALIFGSLLAVPAVQATACAKTSAIDGSGGGGGAGGAQTICVLYNCKADTDCAACSENRKLCDLRSHHCQECNPHTGQGCDVDKVCSQFGSCILMGETCPSDAHGVPTISCAVDMDCAACDAQHQVCDTATSKCVACTPENTGACQHNEVCTPDKTCQPTCPDTCGIDNDCAGCNMAGQPAFFCASQKCVNTNNPMDGGSSGSGAGGSSSSSGGDDGGTTGACHDTCKAGPFMDPSCDACAGMVCAKDDFCCKTEWDVVCVGEVGMYCGAACACSHPECMEGDALPDNCSPCAGKVCAADTFCCTVSWDATCVTEVPTACGVTCQ